MSFDTITPWAVAASALLLLVLVVVTAGVISLRIVLRDTSEGAKPDVIRATGEFYRALLDAVFRWRRK